MNNLKIVFSDFDGTLTFHESLLPIFFEIIDLLKQKNIPLIIVTGRSLSWGHFLLTHFPYLETVIAEGGGVILKKIDKNITEECLVSEQDLFKLNQTTKKLLENFDGIELSKDSFGRKTDRAIELYDLKDLNKREKIYEFLKSEKINFSTSNVHLNFWAGEVSKFKAVESFLKEINEEEKNCLFFGDSTNDQSMFKAFSHSVGVSNIKSVLSSLTFPPKIVLEGEENIGPYGVLNYLKCLVMRKK